MKVRIGITTTDKLIEIEVDDAKPFQDAMESAIAAGSLGWFKDSKGRTVGIPARNIAFIEMEDAGEARKVGFGPGT